VQGAQPRGNVAAADSEWLVNALEVTNY